jgi:hypothetical protein
MYCVLYTIHVLYTMYLQKKLKIVVYIYIYVYGTIYYELYTIYMYYIYNTVFTKNLKCWYI